MGYAADERTVATPEESWFLDTVFTPGTRLGAHTHEPATVVRVVEVREVTTVRVPSGRLIVDSPWPDDDDPELSLRAGRELKERLPSGAFPAEAAWTEAPYEYGGEQFDGREVAAIRLRIRDAPVTCWEMALGVGEDIERISPGERIQFYSEQNMGCFADATAWAPLTQPFRAFWQDAEAGRQNGRDTEDLFDGDFERVGDDVLEADLVTFIAEGNAVVWLGRTETGSVASVVVANGYRPYLMTWSRGSSAPST
ncbi:DUF4241 domain-containing protein [Streptomyces alanosinicus]|nr:DUF4241 domain-containing protein [Streptomyces alanosinicus]